LTFIDHSAWQEAYSLFSTAIWQR